MTATDLDNYKRELTILCWLFLIQSFINFIKINNPDDHQYFLKPHKIITKLKVKNLMYSLTNKIYKSKISSFSQINYNVGIYYLIMYLK